MHKEHIAFPSDSVVCPDDKGGTCLRRFYNASTASVVHLSPT